jgi:hypothetical protein
MMQCVERTWSFKLQKLYANFLPQPIEALCHGVDLCRVKLTAVDALNNQVSPIAEAVVKWRSETEFLFYV